MTDLSADPAAIHAYAASSEQVAAEIARAGAVDAAGQLAALVPILGPIGADVVAAFGVAQAEHLRSVAGLAAHYAATAVAAHASAAGYQSTDDATRAALSTVDPT